MKDNLIVYVSSKNNYDMLEEEVLKNIKLDGFEFINIDDNSFDIEKDNGKELCNEKGITFLENEGLGVQCATQTLINFINKNRPNCKWVICFQHDNYPLSKNFFQRISKLISQGKINEFGLIGFNVLDSGKYCNDHLDKWKEDEFVPGMLGLCHLSVSNESRRWISPKHNYDLCVNNWDNWKNPFIVEMPMWAAVGINVEKWNNNIEPCNEYRFHLWLPDVAMKFNSVNIATLILPKLYCMNDQDLKKKYDIPAKSVEKGFNHYFGDVGVDKSQKVFENRWGWNYSDAKNSFNKIKEKYKDSLLSDYHSNDPYKGALKSYDFGEY